MSLRQQIDQAQKIAMKERNADKLSVLRMLWSAIKNLEIENKHELSDEEVQKLIVKQVKQLKDSQKDFDRGGRQDLVEKVEKELKVLQVYLPEQLSDQEVEKIVSEVVAEIGASSMSEMGRVMGIVMGRLKGQADGGLVRELVQKILSS